MFPDLLDQPPHNTNFILRTSIVAFFHDNDMLNIFGYSEAIKWTIQNSKPLEQGSASQAGTRPPLS